MMKQRGFTLIEMLVAVAIGSSISVLAYNALSGATNTERRVNEITTLTTNASRVWQWMGDDFLHVVPRVWVDTFNQRQTAFTGLLGDQQSQSSALAVDDDGYLLRLVRSSGYEFLAQTQSNLRIVGYRITVDDEETDEEKGRIRLWRDHWRPVDSINEPKVTSRLLLDNIKNIDFRYLPAGQQNTDADAWVSGWPESESLDAGSTSLPVAVKVTIDVDGLGEIRHWFALTDKP